MTGTVPQTTQLIPAYAGIKPQEHTATYALTRAFMPQAYGSDPQGTDGGAFIEFQNAPTGNDNGVPKYNSFPDVDPVCQPHVDYVEMWFDNKDYSWEHSHRSKACPLACFVGIHLIVDC